MGNNSIYPIKPNPDEKKIIEQFLPRIQENIKIAQKEKSHIRQKLGLPTKMLIPKRRDFFGSRFNKNTYLFSYIKEHHFKAVLLVSRRFNYQPEEVLALWQTEGLPSPSVRKYELEKPGEFQLISDWYKGVSPRNEVQAAA